MLKKTRSKQNHAYHFEIAVLHVWHITVV